LIGQNRKKIKKMDFDITWLLLGLPIAFALGWAASRMDLRQLRLENRRSPKAYFKGLNYLLNEQQDLAIDAFIEAVQNDPDTSELHFALGNLFRRRGEYDRAVRVHEHLLSRGDLKQSERDRAQHALSLDFLKAGLLDRAEDALAKLEGTSFEPQARFARLAIYERSRDWAQAAGIAAQLQIDQQGDFSARIAHYLCEQASSCTDAHTTRQLLAQALDTAPDASRARIALAEFYSQSGDLHEAYKTLATVIEKAQAATPLVANRMQQLATQCGQQAHALQLLQDSYTQAPSIDVLEAIIALRAHADGSEAVRDMYVKHLEREPSLAIAARWMAGEKLEHEQFHPQVQKALDKAVKPLLRYRCAACGFEAQQHFWQCPGCQAWDSYPARRVEEL
jgi:lipopolysaccharide assembly protein B